MKLFDKSNVKYLLLAIIVILILFMSAIKTKSEQPTIPITYDFYNSNILDIDQEDNPEYYNVKEQSEYNGNYLAYKSFDDNINNEIDYDGSNDFAIIEISDYLGHNNVINSTAFDYDKDFRYHIIYLKDSIFYLSFWFSCSNVNINYFELSITNEYYSIAFDNIATALYIQEGSLIVKRGNGLGGSENYNYGTIENETWYQITYLFDCTLDTFSFYFDYKLIYSEFNFINDNDFDYLTGICVKSNLNEEEIFSFFLDAFDLSYSQDYSFFRSRIPESLKTGYLEVDKYEFDYNYDNFENNFYNWNEFGYLEDYCDTYIYSDNDIENRIVINSTYGFVNAHGFQYENINSTSMIINVSLNMEILFDSISGNFYHDIAFYDMSNISHFFTYIDFKTTTETVRVFDTNVESLIDWFNYSDNHNYIFNVYINYYDNIVKFFANDLDDSITYMYNCSFPNDYHYQESYGLNKIRIYNYCVETEDESKLEVCYYSVGIYENGKSIIKNHNTYEFGLLNYEIEESWFSDNHNLLTIDSYNTYDVFVHNYLEYYLDGYKILEIFNQTSILNINLADQKDNNYPKFSYENSYLILRLYGNLTNPFEIKVDGIQLIDNFDNTYYGNYYYNDIDTDYNWFYCIDNKLYYNFNNNNTLGTMRITFNVNDILLNNESIISYSSFIYDNYSGNINLISYHLTESFEIFNNDSLIYSYQNITDTENFILSSITIEINCNNLTSDLAKGYIQNINIYPDKSLFSEFDDIDYLESSFLEKIIETIIPLLFFIIPALILRTRFGFKSVLPFWILLTIVFLFTNFIPFWICFIIFLSIALMVLNKESEVIE